MKINKLYSVLFLLSLLLQGLSLKCSIAVKKSCGHRFISERDCIKMGCCYSYHPQRMCYHSNNDHNSAIRHRQLTNEDLSKVDSDVIHTSQCRADNPRVECGHPGISPTLCRQKGCCWNGADMGRIWCFYPTKSYKKDFMPRKRLSMINIVGSRNYHRNRFFASKRSKVVGQLNNRMFSREREFFKQLNKKITMKTQRGLSMLSTSTRPTPTTTTTTTATTPPPTTNRNMDKLFLLLFSHLNQSRQSEEKKKFPTIKRVSGIIAPQTPSRARNHAENIQEFVAYVNFLKTLKRPKSPSSITQVCQLDDEDHCCRNNPTSPCCLFHETNTRLGPMPRVVGGSPAQYLRLSMAYLSRNGQQFCGGTLISADWVLTAAHCVEDYCHNHRSSYELSVSLGKVSKSYFNVDPGQQNFRVINVICHNNQCRHGNRPRLNDIALLRLSRPATMSSYVGLAPLPRQHETLTPRSDCIALGWGNTLGSGHPDILKQVKVPLYTNKQCNHPDWRNCMVRSCMVCAGGLSADLCDGDSGGPLFCSRSNGLYILQGVYSWGRCGMQEKKPSVYTRTSPYVNWISGVISASSRY